MSLRIRIDPADPTPPYEQLRRQLTGLITSGALAEGARLPAVRQLASDLGLAAGTVARSYTELEKTELVVSRRGAGTHVATAPPATTASPETVASPQPAAEALETLAIDAVRRARGLGTTPEALHNAIDAAWKLRK